VRIVNFYNNFLRLCESAGKKPSAAAEEAGLSKSLVSRWKQGKGFTDASALKLAQYFGCSLDDLLWDRDAFSMNLVKIMVANGKSSRSLAAELHVSESRIESWLNRSAIPNRTELIALSERLGYAIDSLDKELIDLKMPAMPKHDGLILEDIKAWVGSAEREELLDLMGAIAARLKEM
jgi:transcriptional regulator with XRE-family HTH domain